MTSKTYNLVRYCNDCPGGCNHKPQVSKFDDLALAVEWTKIRREHNDGSERVALENADGSLVTRGQVRAAGIGC